MASISRLSPEPDCFDAISLAYRLGEDKEAFLQEIQAAVSEINLTKLEAGARMRAGFLHARMSKDKEGFVHDRISNRAPTPPSDCFLAD